MVELATVLPGAEPFKEGNVNDTFRGQVLLADETVRGAVLKDLDPKQLANEVLASVLAKSAGLPTPDIYLALVRGNDLPASKGPQLADGNRIVFASVDVKIPNFTFQLRKSSNDEKTRLFRDLANREILGNLYAFDTWIANIDRHAGNLLFAGQDSIWLIDHGHSFTGPSWNPVDLDANANYQNRLSEWMTIHMSATERENRADQASRFSSVLGSIDLPASRQYGRTDSLLSEADGKSVESFLRNRVTNVSKFSSEALGIPTLL